MNELVKPQPAGALAACVATPPAATAACVVDTAEAIRNTLRQALAAHPYVHYALLFGSVARGQAGVNSDIDIAVLPNHPLSAAEKIALIEDITLATGRPVDLIDLTTVGQPLLSQVLAHGQRLMGSHATHAQLMLRNVMDNEDFMPLVNRLLAQRRQRWLAP
jgi:uncharacterized protein